MLSDYPNFQETCQKHTAAEDAHFAKNTTLKMKLRFYTVFVSLLASSILLHISGQGETTFLDPESKYSLKWSVRSDGLHIDFETVVQTIGFVGFGISHVGKMDGSDIFIAGIYQNGSSYAKDMHGVGNEVVEDAKSHWTLLYAAENATHTHLKFSRLLNTCDDEDFPISKDTTRIIWSYGETDVLQYHMENRGTASFSFLAAKQPEFDYSKYNRFDVTSTFMMPKEETTYWCTIHRGPQIIAKNHIVAFEAFLNNKEAVDHTHHFVLTVCNAPPGQSAIELFEPHVDTIGNTCYAMPEDQTLPFEYCRESLYVWAVGGKITQFPEHVGYPIGDNGQPIYYMLEIHYNNPLRLEGLNFTTGLSFYYTPVLRSIDAGYMWTPHDVNPSLIIPPNVPDFVISTHCAPTCTREFPSEGIKIFNVLLHSHVAGRKMKFRHFRGRRELPWILNDDNYDFNFQQNVHLWNEVNVLPGDQMTVECVFDSTDRNHTVITGGYSTQEEMCGAIFWYYPKIKVASCGSVYPLHTALMEYGVTNYTLIPVSTEISMPWIWAPESLAGPNGMDFLTSLNTKYNWSSEFIAQMRESRQFGEHEFHCALDGQDMIYGNIQYPDLEAKYVPENSCLSSSGAPVRFNLSVACLVIGFIKMWM